MIRRLHVPLIQPEDVRPHLGKPDLHWKTGYSAQELAMAWAGARTDFPDPVRQVLNTALEYVEAELVDGFFEREVELGDGRQNSQTDLMVVAGLGNELGIIAVEGKVEESFDKLVEAWKTSPGKEARLTRICKTLQLDPNSVGTLRYQLLHRSASAIYEAKRYRCRHALMLVHSFSPFMSGFEDFRDFSVAMRIPVNRVGVCSAARHLEGINFRLAWVVDSIRSKT